MILRLRLCIGRDRGGGPLGRVAVLPSVSGVEHIRGQARGEVWHAERAQGQEHLPCHHRAGSGWGSMGSMVWSSGRDCKAVLPSVSGVGHIRGQARGDVRCGKVVCGKVR